MRATCCADDLPKLKPYPWERIFPATTPTEAVDLAQRLLRYDPDERLTASQALAHPFFDGIDQLVDSNSSSSSALPPPTPGDGLVPANRPPLSTADWEQRLKAHFDEHQAGLPLEALSDTVRRHVEAALHNGIGEGTAQQVTTAVRHDLSACLRARDEAMRTLQGSLSDEAKRHLLPWEQEGGGTAAAGAGAGSSSGGGASTSANGVGGDQEVATLKVQLEELKQAQRGLSEAQSEKADMAARLKAAQRRLEGATNPANPANGGVAVEGAAAAEAMSSAEGEKPAPGFGRRAPLPTRQATAADAIAASPMLNSGAAAGQKLQPDNLGQVAPLGYSPGSEAGASPGGLAARPSSSGRRRSRLAGPADGDGAAEAGDGAES